MDKFVILEHVYEKIVYLLWLDHWQIELNSSEHDLNFIKDYDDYTSPNLELEDEFQHFQHRAHIYSMYNHINLLLEILKMVSPSYVSNEYNDLNKLYSWT